ncbi:MAG: type II toxin-antitoxin system RelE/ParE family toxin [Verrucomicrobia subdivision 3 bacterium]|nr:type II toxin-antitoxin system RelE/ParE family toxin [Limisphaerales bacterium]
MDRQIQWIQWIHWEDEALDDLRLLVEHIAADNPDAARRFGMSVVDKVEALRRHPRMGRRYAPMTEAEIREVPVSPYRIFYRVETDRVVVMAVMAVWHGARSEPKF